jgi:endogenous inhibitor of DNA gyrase (YacG/DUF329 family)
MSDDRPNEGGKVVRVTGRRCPICGRPAIAAHRPFCSRRCADVDLGRWLNGDYRVASDDTAGDDDGEES